MDKSLVCTRKELKYPALTYELMLNELKQWIESHPAYYSKMGYSRFRSASTICRSQFIERGGMKKYPLIQGEKSIPHYR
ncbi:MAG: hypothetical protein NTV00_15895 [Methylococcales bacterium]|nr:hypothetical protein [Methylococcales bacterium]